jgi:hypothetical protein
MKLKMVNKLQSVMFDRGFSLTLEFLIVISLALVYDGSSCISFQEVVLGSRASTSVCMHAARFCTVYALFSLKFSFFFA